MAGVIPVPESIVESQTGSGTLVVCQWERNWVSFGILSVAFIGFLGFVIGEAMFGNNALCQLIRESHWILKILLCSPALLAMVQWAWQSVDAPFDLRRHADSS